MTDMRELARGALDAQGVGTARHRQHDVEGFASMTDIFNQRSPETPLVQQIAQRFLACRTLATSIFNLQPAVLAASSVFGRRQQRARLVAPEPAVARWIAAAARSRWAFDDEGQRRPAPAVGRRGGVDPIPRAQDDVGVTARREALHRDEPAAVRCRSLRDRALAGSREPLDDPCTWRQISP